MKEFLLYVSIIVLLIGCNNEPNLYDEGKSININMIKADFERETGYKQKDSTFINPNFRSTVDWKTFYEVGQDTLYVKVKVIDRLEMLVSDSTRILLNDNVWIRGTRKSDKWQYSVLTFIPSSKKAEYNGVIISKSLQSGAQNISFYEANTKVPSRLMKRAGKAPAMPTDCIYGYVNGILNEISCPAGSGNDERDDPPYSGDPRDYQNIPPLDSGTGGDDGNGTVPTYTPPKSKYIIVNNVKNPCLKQMVDEIIDKDIVFKANETLNSIFGINGKFNIIFNESTNLKNEVNGNAVPTQIFYDAQGNISGMDIDIKLNLNNLPSSSQEYIAMVVVHESIHAYLDYKGFSYNTDQHDMMLKDYINVIAKYLADNFKTPEQDAYSVALGGLYKAFQNSVNNQTWESIASKLGNKLPSLNERSRILADYETGYKGSKCK